MICIFEIVAKIPAVVQRVRLAKPMIVLFRALLLGQWHSLSDREPEHSIKVRVDFRLFCGVSFHRSFPDHKTLCRFRNVIVHLDLYNRLLREVNRQLTSLRVKLIMADNATMIESATRPRRATKVIA